MPKPPKDPNAAAAAVSKQITKSVKAAAAAHRRRPGKSAG